MAKLTLVLPGVFLIIAVLSAFVSASSDNSLVAKDDVLSPENAVLREVRSPRKNKGRAKKAKKAKKKSKRSKKTARRGKNGKRRGGRKEKKAKNKKSKKAKKNLNKKKKQKKNRRRGKNKKNKKTKKNKKAKKNNRKRNNRRQGNGAKRSTRQCNSDCVTALAGFGQKNTKATFYNQQASRAINAADKMGKKGGKKGDFKEPYELGLKKGGGNKDKLSCTGNSTDLEATLTELDACSANIESSCNQTDVDSDTLTKLEACKNLSAEYREKFQQLFGRNGLTADQICTNTADADFLNLAADMDTKCATAQANDNALKASRNKCNKAFQACRATERNLAKNVDTCETATSDDSTKTTPTKAADSSSSTTASPAAQLKNLEKEKEEKEADKKEAEDKQKAATEAADTATKIAEKIAATAAAAGSRRFARQTTTYSCAEFSAKVADYLAIDFTNLNSTEITAAIEPYSDLPTATVETCSPEEIVTLNNAKATAEAKASQLTEIGIEAATEVGKLTEEIENLTEKIEEVAKLTTTAAATTAAATTDAAATTAGASETTAAVATSSAGASETTAAAATTAAPTTAAATGTTMPVKRYR